VQGVDVEATLDSGGGLDVGYIEPTEWLAFDVNVATTGVYDIVARVASQMIGIKTLHVEVDGTNVTGAMSFTDSSGWQSWVNVIAPNISLSAGNHTLRIVMDTGGFNLNYVDVTAPGQTPAPVPTPTPTPTPTPGSVVCAVSTASQPSATIPVCNLNIGESARVTLKDGSTRTITLRSVTKDVTANVQADTATGFSPFLQQLP
jgi:hypothetical protein